MSVWLLRYDDERALASELSRESAIHKAQHEAKVAQMEQVMRMETSRRDREIERFRGLVHTLESELRTLRAAAAAGTPINTQPGAKTPNSPSTPSTAGPTAKPTLSKQPSKGALKKTGGISADKETVVLIG